MGGGEPYIPDSVEGLTVLEPETWVGPHHAQEALDLHVFLLHVLSKRTGEEGSWVGWVTPLTDGKDRRWVNARIYSVICPVGLVTDVGGDGGGGGGVTPLTDGFG